jgi:poly(hydroxyalkanoate) granule-associated protein
MVKKLQKMAERKAASAGSLLDSQVAGAVRDSAQQIWLAGMGAFSKAQSGGGKVFETLISEGMKLQRKTQGMAEEKISEVTGRMTSMAGDVTAKAGQHWDKLEAIFEQRTARAMGRLGVPTAKDVETLTKRVEALAAAVAALGGKVPAPQKAMAKKPAAKKAGTATSPSKAPAKTPVRRAARKTAKTA